MLREVHLIARNILNVLLFRTHHLYSSFSFRCEGKTMQSHFSNSYIIQQCGGSLSKFPYWLSYLIFLHTGILFLPYFLVLKILSYHHHYKEMKLQLSGYSFLEDMFRFMSSPSSGSRQNKLHRNQDLDQEEVKYQAPQDPME